MRVRINTLPLTELSRHLAASEMHRAPSHAGGQGPSVGASLNDMGTPILGDLLNSLEHPCWESRAELNAPFYEVIKNNPRKNQTKQKRNTPRVGTMLQA